MQDADLGVARLEWDLLQRIKSEYPQLTRLQRRVADIMARDVPRLAFVPSADLARDAEVSDATVVRLAQRLGYEGYTDMQARVRAQANAQLGSSSAVQRSILQQDFSGELDILDAVAFRHKETISLTAAATDRAVLQAGGAAPRPGPPRDFGGAPRGPPPGGRAVGPAGAAAMAGAHTVYVAAHHWSRSLGYLVVDLLRSVVFHVSLFGGQEEREWQLAQLTGRSVVIGIGFPRYVAETQTLLAAARERGATVIAVTDSVTSALAGPARHLLTVAGLSTVPGADYFAGAVTLLYALYVAVGVANGSSEDARIAGQQTAYRQTATFVSRS